ncbi:MAG TPA: neutral zinc metallopeptidase [Steroidobacteraceae bacterium]|jgi:predicted metalloprotease|nr:neutral zinc metallopeptidase [Steroidobacteraceae bacterium]
MRMDDQGESENVEDVRGSGGFRPIHGISLGGIALALIGGWIFHVNPLVILGLMSGDGSSSPPPQSAADQPANSPSNDPQVKFVRQVLRSTETVWTAAFQERGSNYQDPKLRLFRDSYPTACGLGQSAAGPFYCPQDRIVYLDLGFFDVMTRQLGAPGQFAHAYVIGHEVGHHVQNLLGILGKADAQRERASEAQGNAISVRLELQADCFAGVWANRSQHEQGWRLEPGDIETALHAAAQIGDDTLQRRARGTVVPESFTHGTSAQRVSWFKKGVDSGKIDACDTFGTEL